MTTKKRFYIEDNGVATFLCDAESPERGHYKQWDVFNRLDSDEVGVKYLQELCDLLNKGHEAIEAER